MTQTESIVKAKAYMLAIRSGATVQQARNVADRAWARRVVCEMQKRNFEKEFPRPICIR